jgi:hypothetical protein
MGKRKLLRNNRLLLVGMGPAPVNKLGLSHLGVPRLTIHVNTMNNQSLVDLASLSV